MIEEHHESSNIESLVQEQISLVSMMTESYGIEKRRLKNNKFRVYKCICSKKHHGGLQMLKHKRNCKKRKIMKQRRENEIRHGQNIHSFLEQNQPHIQLSLSSIDAVQDLRRRVDQLEQKHNINSSFDGFRRAQIIYQRYDSAIRGIILNKIASSLENAHRSKISILPIENSIAAAILVKLQNISFDDCIQILSQKLSKAHKTLVEQSLNKKQKTKKHNERAFNFLSQFNEFELNTQIKVFDELVHLDSTHRRNVCRYWSKIRTIDPYFAKFPKFPHLFKVVPRGVMLSRVSINQAAKEIRNIYLNEDKHLACDMWLIITMGLRFHDLLKLQFTFENSKLVKFFKLIQRKNNHLCTRFVPISLIQMIVDSGTIYPIPPYRLRKAVRECLIRFKSSYGFKHRAITAILTALHASNPFGRIHSRPEMTAQHYINQNDEKFLNQSFKVGIKFNFAEHLRQMIDSRNIELDLTGDLYRVNEIKDDQLGEITIECNMIIEDRFQTFALDGHFDGNSDGSELLNQQLERQLHESSTISKNHQLQLIQEKYPSLEDAVANLDQEHQIIEAAQILIQQDGQFGSKDILINKVSELLNKDIYLYDFSHPSRQENKYAAFAEKKK